jgi:hypothetical protein
MATSSQSSKGGNVLNNLVTELLRIEQPETENRAVYTWTNPRSGWVFFASTAKAGSDGRVTLILDDDPADDPIAIHADGGETTNEAMRLLPAGEQTLTVQCKGGGALQSLIVRAIPEINYPGVGYRPSPWIVSYPTYDWTYLKAIGMADVVNVILERSPDASMDVAAWRRQGKKVLTRASTHVVDAMPKPVKGAHVLRYLTSVDGMCRDDRDGLMFDELAARSAVNNYPAYIDMITQLPEDPIAKGKIFHPYTTPMYDGEQSSEFVRATIAAGYKIAEERYIGEQATEEEANVVLQRELVENTRRYRELVPDCQRHMIICLGYCTVPPEWQNVNPGVNWRVFQDMQYHLLANDPMFEGLYGVQCYHSAYADEEVQRWQVKLFRHYCIEGHRDRLTQEPYLLPHAKNGDFADGEQGWTLAPAESGSISVKQADGYSWLQGRHPRTSLGDTFLWTRRCAEAPNCFSQQLEELEPGKLYSLKLYTADYQEFLQRKSDRATHHIHIEVDDADWLDELCFHELFPSGLAGHELDKFDRSNNLWITYRRLVFRARGSSAILKISDWSTADDLGGPVGQELMHNFIEVQPYLEP